MLQTKILPSENQALAYPLLIKRILADSLKYEPKNEIVYRDLTRFNYFELNKRVRKLANVLRILGIKASDSYEFPDFDENSVATMFYTTGTTGNPKAVYFTHRQLVLHTFAVSTAFGSYDSVCRFRSNDVYMPIIPIA